MAWRIRLLLILLASLFWGSSAHTQPHQSAEVDQYVVKIDETTTRMALGRSAFIADLPTEQLDSWLSSPGAELQKLIDQFTNPHSLQSLTEIRDNIFSWRRNETDKILLNAPSRVSWIVVDIQYTGAVETTVMLDLTGADGIAWSYRGPLGGMLSYADDFSLPQGGRPVHDANVVIPVRLAPQQQTRLHINVLTVSNEKFVSFELLSEDQYRAQRLRQTVLDGAYYGLVLALILYNLFLYLALRRRTNLYFCVFAATSAGMIYVSSGLSLVVGLQHPLPLSLPLFYLTKGLMYISAALYSMHLLNIQLRQSRLFRMWAILILVNLLGTFWLVFVARKGGYSTDNVSLTFDAITLFWILNQLVYLVTVAIFWHQSVLARLWFLAISIHIWAMAMWPIILNSALNIEFAPYQLAQLATLINAVLLSALIAHQFRTEQMARVQAQQKAVENLRIAHDLERAKSRFVANVGHDLRGPIQAISHFTSAMKLKNSGETHETLQKIDSNVDKVSELIDSMTRLSQVEWQGTHPDLVPVALADILGEIKTEFSARSAAKDLRLLMNDTHLQVLSDRVCLGQIFRNLMENAIKYTDKGEITVSISEDPDFVSVSIWDTGRGISDDHLPYIFEEFYQVDRADSSGVGLGLAIVGRLCRLLDIQILVASTPGYGTRFTLKLKKYLPQATTNIEPKPQNALPSSTRSLTDMTVLAISQSGDLSELCALLVNWGADVQVKADRKDVLDYLNDEELNVDVILIDNLAFADYQKLISNYPGAPLTIIVANTEFQSTKEHQHTDNIVISKQISPMQFRSLIQRNIPARRHLA